MANNQRRMVYSKIWTSEQFGKLSDKAKLIFIGTITLADDDGRLRANPAYLRGQIFPYDEKITVAEMLQFRNEIEKSGLFFIYSAENCEYIEHPKWKEYQIIRNDLYKKSSLPFRNGSVTVTIQKRDTSKDKISKDNKKEIEQSSISPLEEKEQEIIETDEDGYDLKKRKKTTPRNKLATALCIEFSKMCHMEIGIHPVLSVKEYNIAIFALKHLEEKQIRDLFKDWFASGKPDEEIAHMTRALSANNITNFKIQNGLK